MFHDGSEVRYCLAVILAKSGKTKQAIEIFRKLLYQSPRYYLMVSLNSELNIAKNKIVAFLNRELINIRTMSQKSFENIRKTIEEYGRWFSKDDGDYKTACELFQKVSIIFQIESLSGLMDIPGFEVSVNLLLRRALERRQSNLRKK